MNSLLWMYIFLGITIIDIVDRTRFDRMCSHNIYKTCTGHVICMQVQLVSFIHPYQRCIDRSLDTNI